MRTVQSPTAGPSTPATTVRMYRTPIKLNAKLTSVLRAENGMQNKSLLYGGSLTARTLRPPQLGAVAVRR